MDTKTSVGALILVFLAGFLTARVTRPGAPSADALAAADEARRQAGLQASKDEQARLCDLAERFRKAKEAYQVAITDCRPFLNGLDRAGDWQRQRLEELQEQCQAKAAALRDLGSEAAQAFPTLEPARKVAATQADLFERRTKAWEALRQSADYARMYTPQELNGAGPVRTTYAGYQAAANQALQDIHLAERAADEALYRFYGLCRP